MTQPTLKQAMALLSECPMPWQNKLEMTAWRKRKTALLKAYAEAQQTPTTFGATHCFNCFFEVAECSCGVVHKPKGDDCSLESVVYFGTKPSKEDSLRIEGYLAHKHNMQGDLPDNHPYKDAPPSAKVPRCIHCDSPITKSKQFCKKMKGMCTPPTERKEWRIVMDGNNMKVWEDGKLVDFDPTKIVSINQIFSKPEAPKAIEPLDPMGECHQASVNGYKITQGDINDTFQEKINELTQEANEMRRTIARLEVTDECI